MEVATPQVNGQTHHSGQSGRTFLAATMTGAMTVPREALTASMRGACMILSFTRQESRWMADPCGHLGHRSLTASTARWDDVIDVTAV